MCKVATSAKTHEPQKQNAQTHLSQELSLVGTTRGWSIFFMNKFRKLGFVRHNGELEVHSSLLNVVLHD
jgi:CRP/FNR family transcriptional regulator, cyclic AMP receptor protein